MYTMSMQLYAGSLEGNVYRHFSRLFRDDAQ